MDGRPTCRVEGNTSEGIPPFRHKVWVDFLHSDRSCTCNHARHCKSDGQASRLALDHSHHDPPAAAILDGVYFLLLGVDSLARLRGPVQ